MGVKVFDIFSLGHFLSGGLSFILFKSIKLSLSNNFIFANGIHLILEYLENNISPSGKILESNINHISDIILFLFGWFTSYLFNLYKYYIKLPKFIKSLLCIILSYIILEEIIREIYPYLDAVIFKGAFI